MDNYAETFANLDRFKTVIEIFGVFVSMVIGIGTIWWKLAKLHAATVIGLESMQDSLATLTAEQKKLTNAIVKTSTRTEHQRDDMKKLEAELDIHRKDFAQLSVQFAVVAKDFSQVYRALQKAGIVQK